MTNAATDPTPPGPLAGVRVVELAGIGPIQLACTLMADLGAEVVRVERPGGQVWAPPEREVMHRSRPSVAVNLGQPGGAEVVLRLVERADVLVEAFRPGVAERLGVGPDVCVARNPRLVYSRMTGWGQEGPLAPRAGHDINYLAVTGALHAIGRRGEAPVPPLNLVADFGGGAMFLVVGVLGALLERERSGRGQVVDAAMVDGASYLMAMAYGALANGMWADERGANLLDGAAPFYDTYRCADGRYVAVGAMEPQFFAALVRTLELADVPAQHDQAGWPRMRAMFTEAFAARTRDEWAEVFTDVDACVSPVMSMSEAPAGDHLAARGTFTEAFGVMQPQPAPRLSRTPGRIGPAPTAPGADSRTELARWGFAKDEIDGLIAEGVVHEARTKAADQD
ncbi:L-carnitine dehydratase/bile acid-inducible protein F [Frankia canadensis]|uniref:L-carnitine dehydratase/bile acid-inducible protein F n=1 Tax=Frankia canadensis TaxID=1836972 RepID=A0A2I2KLN7_9ACTN|nr:CaiB/BaiF CoA-transferase family protein [Frankia canadensis]SNQ46577.1 L-carnitine dehydratase/bile acid-inducible protein F [Frankia canadensis]SOU53867.1 L-carnitine dehydratase/bile acid-inducible protein F [Frankia canadensis]